MSRDESEDEDTGTSSKPTKVLPTNRVAFQKQLDILRAFGAAGDTTKGVSNTEVSRLVNLHSATVGLTTGFLADAGFLKKNSDGHTPAQEVIDFSQSHKWSPETAGQRLAPVLAKTWFAETLTKRLRFSHMTLENAIQELALSASAGPAYKGQISMLIEYLETGGLIVRENGHIQLAQAGVHRPEPTVEKEHKHTVPSAEVSAQRTIPVAASFAGGSAGVVQFNISVKVDMTEFAGWEPNRITAFFAGIAQVLAAKGNIERQASSQ